MRIFEKKLGQENCRMANVKLCPCIQVEWDVFVNDGFFSYLETTKSVEHMCGEFHPDFVWLH